MAPAAIPHNFNGLTVSSGKVTFAQTSFQTDLSMTTPAVAPTTALVSGSGSCTTGNQYKAFISWVNASGETALSPASTALGGGLVKQMQITRPAAPANATSWNAYFSASTDSYATVHACGTNGALLNTPVAATTANCLCGTNAQTIITQPTNRTHIVTAPDFTGSAFTEHAFTTLYVCDDGCKYTSLTAALAAISDAAAAKRYLVIMENGDYVESLVTAKSYVSIEGRSRTGTRLRGGLSNQVATVTIPADVTEFYMAHMTVEGAIPIQTINGGASRTKLGFWDMNIGSISADRLGTGSIDTILSHGDNHDIWGQDITAFSAWDGFRCAGNDVCVYDGIQLYIDNATSQYGTTPHGFYNGLDAPGGQIYVNDFYAKIIDNTTTGVSAYGAMLATSGTGATQPDVISLRSGRIEIVGNNASGAQVHACATLGSVGTNTFGGRLIVENVGCRITATSGSQLNKALEITADADHANFTATWQGGSMTESGGATNSDVDNAETVAGFTARILNVDRSGALTGAGTTTYTISDIPAPACSAQCSAGTICSNSSPALCFCTAADTWTKVSGGGACP